ncbi:MAG: glycosyl hydrolase family 18 protein [Marinobacterium sp.]|nr:glycosyl hydrolase family 18 protein [Marinobacterium sp.]
MSDAQYPEWSDATAYEGGEKVSYRGTAYQALWWTKGDQPGASMEWKPVEDNEPVAAPVPVSSIGGGQPASVINGYLCSWENISLTDAANQGYDCISLAFGSIEGTYIGLFGGASSIFLDEDSLKQDIRNAKLRGVKQILLSVGGEHNTYNPAGASASDVARSVVDYLQRMGFTGIDFDLEVAGDGQYLDDLCAEIKVQAPGLIITAAPQINQAEHGSDLFFVSTRHERLYDIAIQNGRFDYLFAQNYNNSWPELDGYGQADVEFMSRCFASLKKSIPANTLLSIGLPASARAAGPTNVFHNASDDIYTRIQDQYRMISEDPQSGGAMVWSINQDEEEDYRFVKSLTL